MPTKTTAQTRILEAVHHTAADLHQLGFITKRKMQRYDALCIAPVPDYDSQKIRALREHLQLSQAVLAAVLNTSLSTVRKWELARIFHQGRARVGCDAVRWQGVTTLRARAREEE
jgi:putative transcriptional regulator